MILFIWGTRPSPRPTSGHATPLVRTLCLRSLGWRAAPSRQRHLTHPAPFWHGHMFPVEHLLEELFLKVLILWPYGLVRTCAFQKAAKSHDDTVWVQPHPHGLLRHAHQQTQASRLPGRVSVPNSWQPHRESTARRSEGIYGFMCVPPFPFFRI